MIDLSQKLSTYRSHPKNNSLPGLKQKEFAEVSTKTKQGQVKEQQGSDKAVTKNQGLFIWTVAR